MINEYGYGGCGYVGNDVSFLEKYVSDEDVETSTSENNDVRNNGHYTDEQDVNNGHIDVVIEDTAGPVGKNESLEEITKRVKKLKIGLPRFEKRSKDPAHLKKGECVPDPDSGMLLERDDQGGYTKLTPVEYPISGGTFKAPSIYVDENENWVVVSKPRRDSVPTKVQEKAINKVPEKQRKMLNQALDKGQKDASDGFKYEAKISQKLQELGVHNILNITTRKNPKTKLRMTFSTYCNRGDLGGVIGKRNATALIPIMLEVAEALRDMHAAGYCYLDVKLENIFLKTMEKNGPLHGVLGDLGTVRKKGIRTFHGTREYMAPEMLGDGDGKKQRARPTMDVFSFGVTLFYVLNGTNTGLFHDLENAEGEFIGMAQSRPEKVEELQGELRKKGENNGLNRFYKIAADCIAFDPKARPTMDEVYERLNEAWALHPSKNTSQA